MKRTAFALALLLVLLVILVYEELAREPGADNAPSMAGSLVDMQPGEIPDWGQGAEKLASAASEKVLFRIEYPEGAWPAPVWFVSAAVSPDSRLVATGKDNGLVEVWDISTLKKRCTVDHAEADKSAKSHVKYVAFAMGGSGLREWPGPAVGNAGGAPAGDPGYQRAGAQPPAAAQARGES